MSEPDGSPPAHLDQQQTDIAMSVAYDLAPYYGNALPDAVAYHIQPNKGSMADAVTVIANLATIAALIVALVPLIVSARTTPLTPEQIIDRVKRDVPEASQIPHADLTKIVTAVIHFSKP